MSSYLNNIARLLEAEDNWKTELGASFPGERVVIKGEDLFSSFSNRSWMDLLLYSISGRNFTKNQLKLFEGIWVICTSYPDPRIWNNRICALAGNNRSTGSLGLAAGIAASEANIYGMRPIIRAFDFLQCAKKSIDSNISLDETIKIELKKYRSISGYGRPIVKKDERIKPLMDLSERLGLNSGAYVNLAFEIERVLIDLGYRMQANIASIAAGLAADQGLSRKEYYYYLLNCFSVGLIACHLDASNQDEGVFFPLKCERISYSGVSMRKW